MASLALSNARAFSSGQWRWDSAEPEYREPFLDTEEGQEWLRESAESLVYGHTVEGVKHRKLVEALETELISKIDLAECGELLAELLADILKSDQHPRYRTANMILGGDYELKNQPLRDLAEQLLVPKADDYCKRMQEEDY